MKKTIRRLKNIIWSLLLSVAIIIESTAGASIAYATEVTDQQTTPDASEITEESGRSQENPAEGEDENDGDGSDTEGGELGQDEEKDPGESDNQQNESEENNDNADDPDEPGGGSQSDPDEDKSDESGEDSSEESEEDENGSDEEADVEESGSEEEELEDPLAALSLGDGSISKDLEQMRAELEEWARETGRIPNGYHDVDYDVDDLTEPVKSSDDSFPRANRAAAVPAKYDAREYGKVSSVKNQAGWGTCWAFSAVNSAESAYKIMNGGDEANLSETHLINFFYNGNSDIDLTGPDGGLSGDKTTALNESPVQRGGNSLFTTFALASWTGVANEATNPSVLAYPDPAYTYQYEDLPISIEEDYAYKDAVHLQNAYWINLSDQSNVKKAVMDYGTVGVSFYSDSIYDSDAYKRSYNSSYTGPAVYYDPIDSGTNHAVAIVGWDDNFDRNYFKNTYIYAYYKARGYMDSELQEFLPKENGAWLIKNSWGESVSDGGYFWMSYENASLADGTAFAFDFESADNYDHNYQYDGSFGRGYYGGSAGVTAAAVYTAQGNEVIEAVGVGFASASVDYTVKVYTNVKNENNPESGELITTVTGKTSFEGFYTIPIEDAVYVEPGEKFGIVVTARKSGGAYLFVDMSYVNGDWISFTASTGNDKTYVKSGSTWYKTGKQSGGYTFRIKAYTRDFDTSDLDFAKDDDKVLRDDMLEEIAPQVYNGAEVEPALTIMFNGDKLTEGNDYEVEFSDNTSAGTATAVVKGKEGSGYTGEITTTFTITKKAITADMIDDISGWTYDGIGHTPRVAVFNDGHEMTEDTDYTVKFNKTPLAAGTYTATVTAAKNSSYSGSAKKTFTVGKLDLTTLEEEEVTLDFVSTGYTGKDIKPAVTVKVGDNTIAPANYTVKYTNTKAAGTATVTVTGKSNCLGTVTKNFTIERKSVVQDDITVTVKPATYSGGELKPAVTVKDGKTTLKLNRDYSIEYSNNINATTDEAKVTVKGLGNYDGEKEEPFTIAPQSVAANKIKVEALKTGSEAGSASYCKVLVNGKVIDGDNYLLTVKAAADADGNEVNEGELEQGLKYNIEVSLKTNYTNSNGKPALIKNVVCKRSVEDLTAVIVDPTDTATTYESGKYSPEYKGSAYKPAVRVMNGDEPLTTKAYSVAYANNVNVGEATITVTGKGDYSGTREIKFAIKPQTITDDDLVITVPDKTYTGSEINSPVTVKVKKKKVKANTDYTYAYSNHTNVTRNGDGDVVKRAKVTVTLKNYVLDDDYYVENNCRVAEAYFAINPVALSSVKLGISYFKGDGTEVKPTLTVKAGKFVLVNNDVYTENDDYIATYYDCTNLTTSKVKASVEIKGKGNFKGTKTVKYSITKEPLSKAKWGENNKLEDRVYEGEEIKPDITLYDSAGNPISADAYSVTYKNNKKVGTASITVKAEDDSIYAGSVTKKFKITRRELKDMISVDADALDGKVYTGSKQTYTADEIKAVVKANVSGDQPTYKISYRDNVNAGKAIVVLTGNGNYQGTVEVPFTIDRRNVNDPNVNITLQSKSVSLGQSPSALAKIKQVVYGKLKLKAKKDYTFSYVNSTKTGVAAVKVTGTGNYIGTKTVSYVIVR